MDRREIERLLDAIRRARQGGEPAAMATIVRVRGSAYRREGTRMLVRHDGTYVCALSGGCLEPAVADAALRVIATGEPVVLNYDLADDSVFGLGIGCSGAVDIRIERLDDDSLMNEWLAILERGSAAALVTPLSKVSGRMIVDERGIIAGGLSDRKMERRAVVGAQSRLRSSYPASGPETIEDAEVFHEISIPAPALVIFGAGDDAAPVARLTVALGFTVTVIDVRESFLTSARFPDVSLVSAHCSQFPARVRLPPNAFVLVMNHHLERDRESLRFSLESAAGYIGVLGPRTRYEKLLAGLAAQGYIPDAAKLARVRSPVGLALGAETPNEVAVSIVGELLAIRRGFEGGFLSGSSASLHRPDASRLLASS
jgi:xanthine/CO dehydrogenase XdhC/CoxF family maturation factor